MPLVALLSMIAVFQAHPLVIGRSRCANSCYPFLNFLQAFLAGLYV